MKKAEKIGLFFGSFNPVHSGHLILSAYIVENTDLDKIWFVVSPQNPLKNKKNLLDEYNRLDLVRCAIEGDIRFAVSDIEFSLPRPSYTIHTLLALEEKFPGKKYVLIMGGDSAGSFRKWKNYEQILDNYEVYVYPRPLSDPGEIIDHPNVTLIKAPLVEVSATYIRKSIQKGKSIKYFVPDKVAEEIDKWGFYK